MYLMLCGYHFTPGDKVRVVLEYLNDSKSLAPVTVNANGQFKDGFTIDCANVPFVILASNESHDTESAVLIDIPRGCTPTPGMSF